MNIMSTEAITRQALLTLKNATWFEKYIPMLKPIPWYHKMWLKMTFQELPRLPVELPKGVGDTVRIRMPVKYKVGQS